MRKFYLVSLVWIISVCAFAQYSGGDGVNSPFQIGLPADLVALSTDEANWDKKFIVTDDLDMEGETFYSIGGFYGGSDKFFEGEFDGNMKIISNLNVAQRTNGGGYSIGFIGIAKGATVKNTGFINLLVDAPSYHRVGGIVATSIGSSVIDNCFIDGGLVQGNSDAVGGIVGFFDWGGDITNCYTNINVKVQEGANIRTNASGIIGKVNNVHNETKISNVVVYGTVLDGNNAVVGVGSITHENVYFKAGSGAASSAIELTDPLLESSYLGFDFPTTWKIDASREYAVLSSFVSLPTSVNTPSKVVSADIYSSGNVMYINATENMKYTVYSLSGHVVSEGLVTGFGFNTVLNVPIGVYIVKVGNATQKIVIN